MPAKPDPIIFPPRDVRAFRAAVRRIARIVGDAPFCPEAIARARIQVRDVTLGCPTYLITATVQAQGARGTIELHKRMQIVFMDVMKAPITDQEVLAAWATVRVESPATRIEYHPARTLDAIIAAEDDYHDRYGGSRHA